MVVEYLLTAVILASTGPYANIKVYPEPFDSKESCDKFAIEKKWAELETIWVPSLATLITYCIPVRARAA